MRGACPPLHSPHTLPSACVVSHALPVQACSSIVGVLSSASTRPRPLSYRAVVQEVELRTGLIARHYRTNVQIRRAQSYLRANPQDVAAQVRVVAPGSYAAAPWLRVSALRPVRCSQNRVEDLESSLPLPVLYGSGKTSSERFLLENGKFIAEQVRGRCRAPSRAKGCL